MQGTEQEVGRMKRTVMGAALLLLLGGASVFGQRKDCEELKTEIAAKIEANGVKNYTLTIVAAAEVKDGDKVVGSCDGGTKRIIYKRG
jgi:hypothetical protein